MPLFKAWNSSRTLKKAVIANSLSEFIAKSSKKLGQEDENVRVFVEEDGTEVDEDEILLSLDAGTILIVGTSWQATGTPATKEEGEETSPNTSCADASEDDVGSVDLNLTEANEEADSPRSTSQQGSVKFHDIFSNLEFPNAKMKGLKTYTEAEIKEAKSELEKKRRQFWNEKSEQLCKNGDTKKLDKTTLYGIIDVCWTLRKTSMLEMEANNVNHDEQVLFGKEEIASGRKLGRQKKDTISKNVERVRLAHNQVELLNQELEGIKKKFNTVTSARGRSQIQNEYKPKTVLFDGAYSELKRAQEALSKSIRQKRAEMEREIGKLETSKTAEPGEKKAKLY